VPLQKNVKCHGYCLYRQRDSGGVVKG